MKSQYKQHRIRKQASVAEWLASFDGDRNISIDFFFVCVVSIGIGIAWLLVANAQVVSRQYSSLDTVRSADVKSDSVLEYQVRTLVRGFPIERMARFIASERRETAAFIVGIAKKESNWGKRVPKKDGQDCFNYWGYRGQGGDRTWDGYTCFHSPKEAVQTIGKRIDTLVTEHAFDTPREMVVWKCGSDCSGHDPASVEKWIQDVGYYYGKVYRDTPNGG